MTPAEVAAERDDVSADSTGFDAELAGLLRGVARGRPGNVRGQPLTIGRYDVLRKLGEGGMGTVYAAFDEQLDRRVAIKLVKGAHSEEARKRMLREAQAMAQLSHPNVVPVFEVGEHGGELFVAMEFVHGMTLDRWRAEVRPRFRDVLQKYLQAGRGLAAAHAKGLVHRDFKPQNAIVGDDGRVRVLDFGLAVRHGDGVGTLEPSMPSRKPNALETPITRTGAMMGTPAYMAPEQLHGAGVDHRSDQFSFCVALWEAAYGRPPFRRSSLAELLDDVVSCRIDEPGPSDAPAALRPILERGLQSRPEDRWSDLPALLAALERLDVDPTRRRRARRIAAFVGVGAAAGVAGIVGVLDWNEVRRTEACHSQAAAESATMWNDDARASVRDGLLATEVGFAASTADKAIMQLDAYAQQWQTAHADACIHVDVDRTWHADDLARAKWCLEQRAMALRSLVDRLAAADVHVASNALAASFGLPRVAPCQDVRLLGRLSAPEADDREGVEAIQEQLALAGALEATASYDAALGVARDAVDRADDLGVPWVRARALAVLGRSQDALAQYDEAATMLERAYFEAERAHDFETTADAAVELAFVVGEKLQRHREGLLWAQHAESALTELGVGPHDPARAQVLFAEAAIHARQADYERAATLDEEALAIREQVYGPDHPHVATSLAALGSLAFDKGEYARARELGERALAIRERVLGSDHPQVADTLNDLANAFHMTTDYAKAADLHERAASIREHAFGSEHPDVALSLHNLGVVWQDAGDYAAATRANEKALAIRRRALGAEHPHVARSLYSLASIRAATGDYAGAKAMFEEAIAIMEVALGPEHPNLGFGLNGLANVLWDMGQLEQARALYERRLAIDEKALGRDHPSVALALHNLAGIHRNLGHYQAARDHYERALAIQERALGSDHDEVARTLAGLANVHFDMKQYAEAERIHRRALMILESKLGADDARSAYVRVWLGLTLFERGDEDGGLAQIEQALGVLETHDGIQEGELLGRFALARLSVRAGRDRVAAIALAERTAADVRRTGSDPDLLKEVEAWLGEHRPRRRLGATK